MPLTFPITPWGNSAPASFAKAKPPCPAIAWEWVVRETAASRAPEAKPSVHQSGHAPRMTGIRPA